MGFSIPSTPRPPATTRARRALAFLSVLAALWGTARTSHAQATSWLYVGGGSARVEHSKSETLPLVQVDAGLGTSSDAWLVWGGLFRVQGLVGGGVDVGLASRFVSSGFARGGLGGGVDLGVTQRWWGRASTGMSGSVVLGAPWGLTLSVGGTLSQHGEKALFASLGLDLARLTVHRHVGLEWMPNPMRSPAPEPE